MTKLPQLPAQHIIDQLKGTLDFYTLHLNPSDEAGIPCCRTWPRYNPSSYPESSRIWQPLFSYINKIASQLPPQIQAPYQVMAGGTALTWKDYLVRCYFNRDAL